MIYFCIGILSAVACILNAAAFSWFKSSQENNFHSIINLWYQDPIEKALLIPKNDDCPLNTEEEIIPYHFNGTDGICFCEKKLDDVGNIHIRLQEAEQGPCSQLQCPAPYYSILKFSPLDKKDMNYYFLSEDSNISYKLCTSRINGYSFSKKALQHNNCNQDEKYCSWKGEQKELFDMNHGYCIPKDRQCYQIGIQLADITQNRLELPLIGFFIDEQSNINYNTLDYRQQSQKEILDQNQVKYPPEYNQILSEKTYIHTQFIPRVKLECRQGLKDALSIYISPSKVKQIYILLVALSCISGICFFFITMFGDMCDFHKCTWKTISKYFQRKRFNKKYSCYRNIYYVVKPSLLAIQIILYSIVITKYISMIDEMKNMIDNKCLDSYVADTIGYNSSLNTSQIYKPGLTYGSLVLDFINLATDQNVYLLIKTIVLFILNILKQIFWKSKKYQIITSKASPDLKGLKQDEKIVTLETQQNIQQQSISKIIKDIESNNKEEQMNVLEITNIQMINLDQESNSPQQMIQAIILNFPQQQNQKEIAKIQIN